MSVLISICTFIHFCIHINIYTYIYVCIYLWVYNYGLINCFAHGYHHFPHHHRRTDITEFSDKES